MVTFMISPGIFPRWGEETAANVGPQAGLYPAGFTFKSMCQMCVDIFEIHLP